VTLIAASAAVQAKVSLPKVDVCSVAVFLVPYALRQTRSVVM
jgi:hypothetical protein